MTKKVSFLICGTQKGGTTALAEYLRLHPALYIPNIKEIHFFDDEKEFKKRPNPHKYHKHFRESPLKSIWGEATPIYMYWEPCAQRIWSYNPSMRLIAILRNPITRAYSHWSMEYGRGNESLDFESAIKFEEERCRDNLPHQHRIFSYVDRGFYSNQIRRLWRFFGKDSLLILKQEDLKANPDDCLNQIYKHLNIRPIANSKKIESHKGDYPGKMNPSSLKKLKRIFWHEICQLESLLNWDCSDWLKV